MESKGVQKGGKTFHEHQNGESEYAKGKEDHIERNVALTLFRTNIIKKSYPQFHPHWKHFQAPEK